MTTVNIIAEFDSKAPVYMQYAGQCQPQPAYIALDADGDVYADYNSEIGNAVPCSVWNGLDRRIDISPFCSANGLQQLFADKAFVNAVNRYYAGRSTEWDGNNWTSELNEDAEEALSQLEQMCDMYEGKVPTVGIYTAGDWIENLGKGELEDSLTKAGSVEKFVEEQTYYEDFDQYLNFDADDMAKALSYRFEGEADYIEAIKIIVAHDAEYQYLLDDLADDEDAE